MDIRVHSRRYAYIFLYGLEPEELVNTFLYGFAFSTTTVAQLVGTYLRLGYYMKGAETSLIDVNYVYQYCFVLCSQ